MVLGNGQWNPDRPSADFANKNHQEKDKTVITDSDKMEKKFWRLHERKKMWQPRDSNPRLRRDRNLNPTP